MGNTTFAIMGGTGRIGSVCATRLLERGHHVRVLGRNAQKLQQFQNAGAETFEGAFDNSLALTRAFDGADAVFTFLPTAYEVDDVAAYENLVSTAISRALRAADVRTVVNLSAIGADKPYGAGATMIAHYSHELRLNEIPGLMVIHLRPGWFMENFAAWVPMIKALGKIASPLRSDVPLPMVSTRDIGNTVILPACQIAMI